MQTMYLSLHVVFVEILALSLIGNLLNIKPKL